MKEKKAATLHLVRHGQTDWNAERRIQGSIDRALTEMGISQAHDVGQKLAALPVVAVYSSPLIRAKHTAEIIASYHGHAVLLEPALREGSYGSSEGMTVEQFNELHKEAFAKKRALPREERMACKIVPDGESSAEIMERVVPALQRIAEQHVGEDVIVVTHGFVMRILLSHLSQIDEEEIHIGNAQVLMLTREMQTFRVAKAAVL